MEALFATKGLKGDRGPQGPSGTSGVPFGWRTISIQPLHQDSIYVYSGSEKLYTITGRWGILHIPRFTATPVDSYTGTFSFDYASGTSSGPTFEVPLVTFEKNGNVQTCPNTYYCMVNGDRNDSYILFNSGIRNVNGPFPTITLYTYG